MRINVHSQLTRVQRRTAVKFLQAFYEVLKEKTFEEITVNDICDQSGYPRATFYHYFKDKYDILELLWENLAEWANQIDLNTAVERKDYEVFSRIYDMLAEEESFLPAIFKGNGQDSYFVNSLHFFFRKTVSHIFANAQIGLASHFPPDIAAEHISNTFFLIFRYRFVLERNWTKEETWDLLQNLLFHPLD